MGPTARSSGSHMRPPATAGAENSYNLFAVRRNPDAATDEDRSRLEVRGGGGGVGPLGCGLHSLLVCRSLESQREADFSSPAV